MPVFLCSGWRGPIEGLHCGTQKSEGPGLGLKEVLGRALAFWSCGGRIQIAGTMSKSQIWGQQESVV